MEKAILRVLIVDDFQPWRQFLLSTLQKLPQFRVIGEESDGLSAVRSAEKLNPDLIILDISLPELHGIEAARRIRKLSPNSKVLFASADRSWETVEAALETGAGGYLVKTDAGSELLPAIEAVVESRTFISSGVARERAAQAGRQQSRDRREDDAVIPAQNLEARHKVDFYPDDMALVNGFCRVIGTSLKAGAAVIAVATAAHHSQILERFTKNGVGIHAAIERGAYVSIPVAEALEMIMAGEMPDPERCTRLMGDLIAKTGKAATAKGARVAICGEGGRLLLQEGKTEAAIRFERIWDEITKGGKADTLCGYLSSAFPEGEDSALFRRICAEHSAVHGKPTDQT